MVINIRMSFALCEKCEESERDNMNISIVILDKNQEYAERLSDAFQQYAELTIKRYTGLERFRDAMKVKKEKFDIVLFDPDISQERLEFYNVRLPICLYSDEAENRDFYADFAKVAKYQRISGIYKEIMREYADKAGYSVSFNHGQKTQLIAVYSPVGGSGKTAMALILAGRMAGLGKTALFISMEQLDSSFRVNPRQEEGITALVEAAKNEKVNFGMKLKGTMKKGLNGMFYLEGFDRVVDYDAVTERELSQALDNIKDCGVCDAVLVDMESRLDAKGSVILELADHIILVEKPGELPAAKMKLFAGQAVMNEHKHKMVKLYNFAESHSHYCLDIDIPLIGTIHNYGNLPLEDMIKTALINQEFQIDRLIGGRED